MVRLTPVNWEIWKNKLIHQDLWSGPKWTRFKKYIETNGSFTAKLLWSVHTDVAPCAMSFRVNAVEVTRINLPLGGSWDGELDVTSRIFEGSNEFFFEVWKEAFLGWGDTILNLSLVTEGDVNMKDELPQWVPYATIGVGMAIAGGVILYYKSKGEKV